MPRLVAREFATAVKALCFTSDGRYLAASGDGKRIWVGAMDPRPQPIDVLDQARAASRRADQRALRLAGSADPDQRQRRHHDPVLGPRGEGAAGDVLGGEPAGRPGAAAVQELDWVLYTPEGYFDASAEATRLVHYRRPAVAAWPGRGGPRPRAGRLAVGLRSLEEAGQLDQLAATHNIFGLGEQLLRGEVARPEAEVRGARADHDQRAPPANRPRPRPG